MCRWPHRPRAAWPVSVTAWRAAQDDLTRIAPDEHRAEVSAALDVCIYLGVALPVIGILAVLTTLFGVTTFAVVPW